MISTPSYFVIVPAAGIGKRMGESTPKQYLKIRQRTILEYTLKRLLFYPLFEKVVVVIDKDDCYWPDLAIQHPKLMMTFGGASRFLSVINGLHILKKHIQPQDWVLVHDAVRPCLSERDITQLITQLSSHPIGGVLGVPITNTVKQIDAHKKIKKTFDRERLWQALTPQMFRYALLVEALENAYKKNVIPTDESSAIESLGKRPQIIPGSPDNIKITTAPDLQLAEFYLRNFKEF